jgi:hypothetical protein
MFLVGFIPQDGDIERTNLLVGEEELRQKGLLSGRWGQLGQGLSLGVICAPNDDVLGGAEGVVLAAHHGADLVKKTI